MMNPKRRVHFARCARWLISALVATVLLSTPVSQAEESSVSSEAPGHILGGHRFLPSFFFPNPFAVPTFELDLGLSYGTFDRFFLGETRELKVGSIGPKLEAQIKLVDRLMFIIGVNADVGFGLNGESIGLYGAHARYKPRLGLLWGVLKTDDSALTLGFEWEKPLTLQASPIDIVADQLSGLLGNPDEPAENLIEVTRWRPTVRFAHALSPMFGIVAFGGMNFVTESFNSLSSNSTQFTVGASLDTSFKPVPLGLTLNYRYTDGLSSDDESSHIYTIGLFENLSERFNFGIEGGRLERGGEHSTIGALVTRYYY